MKISEFIRGKNVNYDTVRRYINRNPEMFKGHVGRANKIELDDIAVQLLEKKYPFPEPVQVIQDQEAREKLQEVTEKYAAAMEKITALTEQNAQLLVIQSKQRFLEEEIKERDQELLRLQRENENWMHTFKSQEREIYEYEADLKESNKQIAELRSQLEREKNKTWWDKLRGR